MAATYTPIASITLGASASSVTFSSIPQTYTDLVIVCNAIINSGTEDSYGLQFNSDTAGNYSATGLVGSGSSAFSYRGTSTIKLDAGRISLSMSPSIIHIMNYANTTTNKTVISRANGTGSNSYVGISVGLWRSTAAITSINISPYNNQGIASDGTFNLYGILGANA
jgi:hypothetical protein